MLIQKFYKFKLNWFQLVTTFVLVLLIAISKTENNYIYLTIGIPFLIGLVFFEFYFEQLLVILLLLVIFSSVIYLTNYLHLFTLNEWISKNSDFYNLRLKLMSYISSIYPSQSASFIKLLLFNFHDANSFPILKSVSSLNVSYLFIVSGFHINLLLSLLNFIFFKNRFFTIKKIFGLLFCLFYGYFLGYSIGILRICLNFLLKLVWKNLSSIETNVYSGLLIGLFLSSEFSNIGFLMTYVCSIYINYLVWKLKDRKILLSLFITVGCFVLTLPMVLKFTDKFNVYFFFLNYIYSLLVPLIYFYLLFTFYIIPLAHFNNEIISKIIYFISLNLSVSSYLYLNRLSNYYISVYYLIITSIALGTYLILKKDKIHIIKIKNKTKNLVY